MSVQVIQSLVNKDGARVELPPWFQGAVGWGNLAHPNVYLAEAQAQYPPGTKYVEGDRIFRYVKYVGNQASSAWIYSSIAATNGDDCMGRFLFNASYAATYASTYTYGVTGTNTVEVDTLLTTVEKANNFYSGGWMSGKDTAPADARFFFRRILAHDYSAAKTVGGSAKTLVGTMTVDQNLVDTFTAMALSLTANPYKRIVWRSGDGDAIYGQAIGASMCNNPTVNYYCWVQSSGPCGCLHISTDFGGASERETIYNLRGDGAVDPSIDQTGKAQTGYPTVGYLLPCSISETGSGQDDNYPIIWITLNNQ